MQDDLGSITRHCNGFDPVVVVPTYDNAQTLAGVLSAVDSLGLPLIVVDDGSTDTTAEILSTWFDSETRGSHRRLAHSKNCGKAAALRTGFIAAREAEFTHAVTIDSDGQLDAGEIPVLLDAARLHPASLVVGVRDVTAADYPSKSRWGRLFSNAAVKLECGARVSDSQCGFRVYPLGLVEAVDCGFGRYAFETEVLTRAVWAGAGIVECPVRCRYAMPEGRVTHFRPGLDTLHGLLLHARLLLRAMMPLPHPHVWHDPNGREKLERDPRPWWRRALHWINPLAAWRGIRAGDLRRDELAAGLAVGVFIGNLPVYGLHTVICLYTSARLHLNPHLVVVGSSLFATPPLGLVFIAVSIATGHFLLHGDLISPAALNVAGLTWGQMAGRFLLEWVVGSLVVGLAMALISGAAGYAFFGLIQRRNAAVESRTGAARRDVQDPAESV